MQQKCHIAHKPRCPIYCCSLAYKESIKSAPIINGGGYCCSDCRRSVFLTTRESFFCKAYQSTLNDIDALLLTCLIPISGFCALALIVGTVCAVPASRKWLMKPNIENPSDSLQSVRARLGVPSTASTSEGCIGQATKTDPRLLTNQWRASVRAKTSVASFSRNISTVSTRTIPVIQDFYESTATDNN